MKLYNAFDLIELKKGWFVRPCETLFHSSSFNRYEPLIIAAMVAGTGMKVMGNLQEGKAAQDIGNARAAVAMARAEAERKAATLKGQLVAERGRRTIEGVKGELTSRNIKLGEGVDLVLEAQQNADLAKDIGSIFQEGEDKYNFYRQSAAIEKAQGKALKKKSQWDAIASGIGGFTSLAGSAGEAGGWSNLLG